MSDPVEREFFRSHRAHDPTGLLEGWRELAPSAGLSIEVFAEAGAYPLHVLKSSGADLSNRPRVYLSSGVHGDEPGAAQGLLYWAQQNGELLASLDATIFPLLNPWGLENNRRHDELGRDLNRLFHSHGEPFPAWRRTVGSRRFDLSICMHEDYDARGSYIYELGLAGLAERLLGAGAEFIPPDPRSEIDDSIAVGGVVRHGDLAPEDFPLEGLPEAVWMYFERCPVSLNLETPSQFSLFDRVRAHAAMLSEALKTL